MIRYERVKHEYFKNKMVIDSNYFLSHNGKILTTGAVEIIIKNAGEKAKLEKTFFVRPTPFVTITHKNN